MFVSHPFTENLRMSVHYGRIKKDIKINSIWNGNAESVRMNNEYWMKKELLIKQ